MSEDLDILYKVLTREQTTGYRDSSVLGNFEEFVSDWCDKILARNDDQKVQKVLQDIRLTSKGYGTVAREARERKITEIGRMLLSLRDLLQHISDRYEAPLRGQSDRDALKDRGMAYKQEGKFTEAIAEFEKVLESSPDDSFATLNLAHIYLQQGKLDESNRLVDRALKVNPANPFAHAIRGEILFREGNMEEAATVFEGLLNLKPDDTYVYSKLGTIYRKQNKIREATSILNRGLEINPEDPALHHALGDVHAWLGKDEEAIAEYQRAIDIDPEDEYAFRGLLSSKAKGRDAGSIISQLQKILKIPSRKQNPHLHALLAKYLKQEKQYEAAAAELRESVKLQPNSLYFQTQLAFCYSRLGQYLRVIELLEPISKIRPRDRLVIQSLAKAYARAGRIEDARKLLIEILYVYPNNRSLRSALMNLGKSKASDEQQRDQPY